MKIAAVTGTNGKSTTAYLIADAAERCGLAAGYSGTVGYGRISALQTTTHTTPDVVSVHRQMAELRDADAKVVGMEVSSHALHQARIAALRVDTAVFTNLTRDHLDYHGDMQAYGDAKALLFQVPGLRHRVINADDVFGRELLKRPSTAAQTTAYSCRGAPVSPNSVYARTVRLSATGLELEITGSYGDALLRSPLLGRFNAENLLATLAVLLGWGVPMQQAVQACNSCCATRSQGIDSSRASAPWWTMRIPRCVEKALTVLKGTATGVSSVCLAAVGIEILASGRRWGDRARLADVVSHQRQSA
jgi:UDP-N-acetylmuramoyl-L-alanyl-D-glutamate--2,6-diaminopimelate ligase